MSEEIKLTGKQKAFIEAYLGEAHFNATKAAEIAGYKGTRQTLGAVAYENLKKPQIKAEIDAVLSAMTMPANAVLAHLTEIAESDAADVCDENGNFSFELAKKRRKTHLIKKMKVKRTLKQKKTEVREDMRTFLAEDEISDIESDVEILYEEVEYEMYSRHEGLRDLGKHHKLFTDKQEIEHGGRIEVEQTVVDQINKIYDGESKDK